MARYWRFVHDELPMLAFGGSLTFLSSFGQTFFVSLFVPFLLVEFGLGNAEFGTIYAAATLASALTLPWTGRWMDRVSLSRVGVVIAVLLGGAAFLLAASGHVLVLFLGFFGLRLAGPGLAGYAALTAMAREYTAGRRGRALGVSSLGYSVGEAVLPIAGTTAIAVLGWRGGWMLVGAISLLVFGPLFPGLLAWARVRTTRSTRGRSPGSDPEDRSGTVQVDTVAAWEPEVGPLADRWERVSRAKRQWTRRQMLGDPRFWFLLPAALLPPFWATGIFLYQTSIGDYKGWSLTLMASAFTVYAAARVAFSLVGGGLVDRLTARVVFPLSLVPMALGLFLLIPFSGVWVPYAFMACLGMTTGVSGNARAALWAELYGVVHLGSIKALMAAFVALSTAGSPILVGAVMDAGTGLERMLWAGIVSVAVGLLLAFGASRSGANWKHET